MFRKYILVPYWKWCLEQNQKEIEELETYKRGTLFLNDKARIDFDIQEIRACNRYLRHRIKND